MVVVTDGGDTTSDKTYHDALEAIQLADGVESGGFGEHVATREAGGGLTFAVTDTGIGIEPAALASLCEPFTQADASISRHYGGTGLGLAISRKLMTLHGGTLTIDSTLGQGTTVRIGFPAARVIEMPRSWVGSEAMAK